MTTRRRRMSRELASGADVVDVSTSAPRYEAPRLVRQTIVDFGSLGMPVDVARILAEAFWSYFGATPSRSFSTHWHHIKVFGAFVRESAAVTSLSDVHGEMLLRYVEWLNIRCRLDGQPWAKSTRASTYTTIRKLLQWIERCHPGTIVSIKYPFNPFPWRSRDTQSCDRMPAAELKSLLRACEEEIACMRAGRDAAAAQRAVDAGELGTLGWLLDEVERSGGTIPMWRVLSKAGHHPLRMALKRFGGVQQVAPYIYPRVDSLLPYYLAIMVHAAGNPEPIAEIDRDCLHSLPLLEDRQALVWSKGRASSMQRRTFDCTDRFGPPSLVKEILGWNERLRPLAPVALRDRLFLYQSRAGVSALTADVVKGKLKAFCERHGLPRFSLVSIRPGVLTSFYRVSGDLRRAKAVANHANLSTTVRYVQAPEVKKQNRARIASLQQVFLGHVERGGSSNGPEHRTEKPKGGGPAVPAGELVSMFGFGCKDPYAGAFAGTRIGELCTNFMGCFTCPNAIITSDPATLARLLQARDHMRAFASVLHPARWQAFYAPQLRILEEDILPRFSSRDIAAAQPLVAHLPPLPDIR